MMIQPMPTLLLILQLAAPAPDSIGRRLQAIADSIVAARPHLPGLLLYAKSGATGRSWQIAAGWSDTARKIRLESDQPIRLASNTKTYTAAAILRLVERGTLALSDPIARHLPAELNGLLLRDGYPTERITVEQVLSQRAGLNEHPSVPSFLGLIRTAPNKRWTREEQVRWMVDSLQPVGAPGAQFKYSDTGYILLGAILERHTGKNLAGAERELLGFDRLGLTRTWFETLEPTPAAARDRAHQYLSGMDSYNLDPSFDLYGGGGIVAPVAELGQFLQALFDGKVFDRATTLDSMLVARSPDFGGYGYGIFRRPVAGETGLGHAGFWGTAAYYFPESKVTIAIAVTEQTEFAVINPTIELVLRAVGGGR